MSLLRKGARLQWLLPVAQAIVFFTVYPRHYWISPQSAWRHTAQEWLRSLNWPAMLFVIFIYPLQRLVALITGWTDLYLYAGYYPRELSLLFGSLPMWFVAGWVFDDVVKAQKPLGRIAIYGMIAFSTLCLVAAWGALFGQGHRDYSITVSCACWCAVFAGAAYRVRRRMR